MKCYLDSSALLKRSSVDEPAATELRSFLEAAHQDGWSLITSVIGQIEVTRGVRRMIAAGRISGADVSASVEAVIGDIQIIDMSPAIADEAGAIDGDLLRSLDAIHLATARVIGADMVVTYDDRMAQAALQEGALVAQPGADAPKLPDGLEWL